MRYRDVACRLYGNIGMAIFFVALATGLVIVLNYAAVSSVIGRYLYIIWPLINLPSLVLAVLLVSLAVSCQGLKLPELKTASQEDGLGERFKLMMAFVSLLMSAILIESALPDLWMELGVLLASCILGAYLIAAAFRPGAAS